MSQEWATIVYQEKCYHRGCLVNLPKVHRSLPMGEDCLKHWRRRNWVKTIGLSWLKTGSNGGQLWNQWIEDTLFLFFVLSAVILRCIRIPDPIPYTRIDPTDNGLPIKQPSQQNTHTEPEGMDRLRYTTDQQWGWIRKGPSWHRSYLLLW